jgi:hypothetical protein
MMLPCRRQPRAQHKPGWQGATRQLCRQHLHNELMRPPHAHCGSSYHTHDVQPGVQAACGTQLVQTCTVQRVTILRHRLWGTRVKYLALLASIHRSMLHSERLETQWGCGVVSL